MLNPSLSRLPRVARLTILLLSGTAFPALALDADDFVAKLNAAYVVQGGEITYAEIEADGSDITLTQAKFVAAGRPSIEVGDLSFEDGQ